MTSSDSEAKVNDIATNSWLYINAPDLPKDDVQNGNPAMQADLKRKRGNGDSRGNENKKKFARKIGDIQTELEKRNVTIDQIETKIAIQDGQLAFGLKILHNMEHEYGAITEETRSYPYFSYIVKIKEEIEEKKVDMIGIKNNHPNKKKQIYELLQELFNRTDILQSELKKQCSYLDEKILSMENQIRTRMPATLIE